MLMGMELNKFLPKKANPAIVKIPAMTGPLIFASAIRTIQMACSVISETLNNADPTFVKAM